MSFYIIQIFLIYCNVNSEYSLVITWNLLKTAVMKAPSTSGFDRPLTSLAEDCHLSIHLSFSKNPLCFVIFCVVLLVFHFMNLNSGLYHLFPCADLEENFSKTLSFIIRLFNFFNVDICHLLLQSSPLSLLFIVSPSSSMLCFHSHLMLRIVLFPY